jgi:hypothetical protein
MKVPRLILTDHHVYSVMPSPWKMSDFVERLSHTTPEQARTWRPTNRALKDDVGHALRNTAAGLFKGK